MILQKKKQFIITVLVFFLLCTALLPCGCNKTVVANDGNLVVIYLDVGEGDSCFIKYPDGKTMLIDSGAKSLRNAQSIIDTVNNYGGLDYLLITHPDADHIGNASTIVQEFQIEKAFLPYIQIKQNFVLYSQLVDTLSENRTNICYFDSLLQWKNEGCLTSFLTPLPSGVEGSSIDQLNLQTLPTEQQINNLSPIIYIEYQGIRFLFTGDADFTQEQIAVEGNLETSQNRPTENLHAIDFLKVSHHGSNDGTSEYFVNYICPKNAIISVGAGNNFGHPSASVINRLTNGNKNINIYRTDTQGDITVKVQKSGRVEVYCAR